MDDLRICITGASGYLARLLISKLSRDEKIKFILGVDARKSGFYKKNLYEHLEDGELILDPLFRDILIRYKINMVVHLAWVFNPTHDTDYQYRVDVLGTQNVFRAARAARVNKIVYAGSTTAYGQRPRLADSCLYEHIDAREIEQTAEGNGYLYSKHKAIVDRWIREEFDSVDANLKWVLIRGAIVAGHNTRNVVSQMASLPAMPMVAGYDPPMQFISEDDMAEILYLSVVKPIWGVFNAAADGAVLYSDIIKILGKTRMPLPAAILYPALKTLWSTHIIPFSPSILDLIRYPWVASSSKLKESLGCHFGFQFSYDSRESIEMLAEGLAAR